MEKQEQIISIAFEGMHRSGKGVQIELLKERLIKEGIPFVDIRGSGSRTGKGETEGDPSSQYWIDLSKELHGIEGVNNIELWERANYRLARELIVWRDRFLKSKIANSLSPFGVLIIDRSLISNALLKGGVNQTDDTIFTNEDLFKPDIQNRRRIDTKDVLPDIIFELIAPKDVLISRLDEKDPKYEFRKHNIEEKYDLYSQMKQRLESGITERIVTIDSSADPDRVFQDVENVIKNKFPDLLKNN